MSSTCLKLKIQVHAAINIPTLLYGTETWVLYWTQIRLLKWFHHCCMCSILGIKWQNHVSNKEVLKTGLAASQEWKTHACPQLSSSAGFKKESVIVVLQESVTTTS